MAVKKYQFPILVTVEAPDEHTAKHNVGQFTRENKTIKMEESNLQFSMPAHVRPVLVADRWD